jgi:hypothetical protein
LSHFRFYEERVSVSFGVVFDENIESFLASVFADEESRTFGEEAVLVRGIT